MSAFLRFSIRHGGKHMVIDVESRALPNESNVELTLYMKTMVKYMESNK